MEYIISVAGFLEPQSDPTSVTRYRSANSAEFCYS